MRNAFYQLLLLLVCYSHVHAAGKEDFLRDFKLLPQPQKTEMLSGKGITYTSLQGIQLRGSAKKPILPGLLQALPFATSAAKGLLILELASDNNIPSDEGYLLEVQNLLKH